ncbi:hypothetical protein CXG81DRAFT_17766 [Caulochytrium protostelioides]|uniref:Ribosomal protein L35 n=1 Tax=Caulochytrium protostelioides TaxID=1555241 RepID=A0A4P9XB16_9FUNG|nr:hypothetical protein CXG81DRAFT_17766 [Caulochytrium protostelioides]|eukprot:RKP02556.1 hypothetical protein CXG81DRAFT_17766 [Caulochytrium protostelioides]
MTKVTARSLRQLSKPELSSQLSSLKQELATLRTQKATGATASKVTKIHDVRKSIARVHTVTTQVRRAALIQFYQGKKYVPLDLRKKLTRAMRRRLTPREANAKTLKQKKDARHFGLRRFAVMA